MWLTVPVGPLGEPGMRFHVIPLEDFREHECTTECWCGPTEDHEQQTVFVHHALDGREAFESGERKVS